MTEVNENVEVAEQEEAVEEKPKAKKTKGIFRIFNEQSGFEHYGVSSQVEVCFRDYHKQLNNGRHSNKKLQAEFDESHGAIEMEIIEEFPIETSLKDLHAAKKAYLDNINGVEVAEEDQSEIDGVGNDAKE